MKSSQETQDESRRTAARKPRVDGVESRRTIVEAAARLATTRGLEGLSIGELAAHVGMSKSGLYAHFKSKEELELATIDAAAEIFERDVVAKIPASARGLGRLTAMTEAFLKHLARRVFPGGCFFATVAAQLAPHPGPTRDRIMQMHAAWGGQMIEALRQARETGEIQREADLDQLAFEISAMLFRANFNWLVTDDKHALDQARRGVKDVLARVVTSTPSSKHRRPKKA